MDSVSVFLTLLKELSQPRTHYKSGETWLPHALDRVPSDRDFVRSRASCRLARSRRLPFRCYLGLGLDCHQYCHHHQKFKIIRTCKYGFNNKKRFFADLRGNHISSNLWLYARLYHGAQVNHFTHIHQGAELLEVLSFLLSPMQICFLILPQTRNPEKEKRRGQRPEELNHYYRLRAIPFRSCELCLSFHLRANILVGNISLAPLFYPRQNIPDTISGHE